MKIRKALPMLFALIALLAVGILSAPAASAAANYCSYNMSTESGKCFNSERELLSYNSTQVAVVNYITVYNWIDYNTGAGYKTIRGSTNCTPAVDNEGKQIANLDTLRYDMPNGSVGPTVNNSISSVIAYDASGCAVKFFDGTNYTGGETYWLGDTPNLSSQGFYDRASSLKIS